jgi:16S rRNA C967 or C1407 C5-methylase (RsmB/RsmF family)
MDETARGNITRQEAVSMLPPLLLDVHPGQYVLDMCAAPGSKTSQILEALYDPSYKGPAGFVVANDADPRRAYLLTHQVKRMDTADFLITTHEGQFFPNMLVLKPGNHNNPTLNLPVSANDSGVEMKSVLLADPGESMDDLSSADLRSNYDIIKFDRVLADVPCSGDGTMRKNLNLWKDWGSHIAQGLHCLQLQIAQRAAIVLKEGGLMVYSTCSFSPLENEAVVQELLRLCQGALEVVDPSSRFHGLQYSPGLLTWRVMDKNQDFYDCMDQVPSSRWRKVKPSMFPVSEEHSRSIGLQHCMRLLPHKANTGGFFLCLLRKVGPIPRYSDVPPRWVAPAPTPGQVVLGVKTQEKEIVPEVASSETPVVMSLLGNRSLSTDHELLFPADAIDHAGVNTAAPDVPVSLPKADSKREKKPAVVKPPKPECFKWKEGTCTRNASCRFSHDGPQGIPPVVCRQTYSQYQSHQYYQNYPSN